MAVIIREALMPSMPTDPQYYTYSVQNQLTAINMTLMIIALVLVLLRIYIRVCVLGVFRLDDLFMVAAMVCSIVSCSIFFHVIRLGMGKHILAIPPENIQPLFKWVYIVGIIIPWAVFFVKMSIGFFLVPLVGGTRMRNFVWGIIVFLIILILFSLFSLVLNCLPVEANWDFTKRPPPLGTGNAKCMPVSTFRSIALFNTITNIITDCLLALIPVPLIWNLQINRRTKLSLCFILSLGFFACAAGIVKAPLLAKFFSDTDATGNNSWYYAWQIIEMNIGIIAATLPSLKPLFRWLLETAKTLATGASRDHTSPSRIAAAYKQQSSSGYIRQSDHIYSGHSSWTNRVERVNAGHYDMDDVIELKDLERYGVEIAGNDSGDDDRGQRGSQGSSEAIVRAGGEGWGLENERSIVKTTKVTIVTTQNS